MSAAGWPLRLWVRVLGVPECAEGGAESAALVGVGDLDPVGVQGGELGDVLGGVVASQMCGVHAVTGLAERLGDAEGGAVDEGDQRCLQFRDRSRDRTRVGGRGRVGCPVGGPAAVRLLSQAASQYAESARPVVTGVPQAPQGRPDPRPPLHLRVRDVRHAAEQVTPRISTSAPRTTVRPYPARQSWGGRAGPRPASPHHSAVFVRRAKTARVRPVSGSGHPRS